MKVLLDYSLQWTTASGATRYELQEQKNSGSWTLVHNGASTQILFTKPAVANYGYRVRACDNSSCIGWSAALPAMRLKETFTGNNLLGTATLRSKENRATDKAQYTYPFGQQEDKQ
jgi:hypothetical protein